jgi:hypothetical protein
MATMHKVEVLVHVDDVLGEDQQAELIDDLRKHGGVGEANFTPGRTHLLVIEYDRDQVSSKDILENIRRDHLRAELIGGL